MKDDRTTRLELITDCALYGGASLVWYGNILFRRLPNATYGESQAIYWAALAVFGAVGLAAALKRECRLWVFLRWLILAYAIYTVCAYAQTYGRILVAAAVICLAVSCAYGLWLRLRMAGGRRRRRHPYIRRWLSASSSVFAVGALAVMVLLGTSRIFGDNLIRASEQKMEVGDVAGMMESSADTLVRLKEETWRGLSTVEKLNVLQTAASIQAVQLGLPNEIRVGASNLEEHILGNYSDDTYMIAIDLDHLENGSARDVLNTCFHELYHSYEHRAAEAYRDASPELKTLVLYRRAAEYAWELDCYENAKENPERYIAQRCEVDSRAYADGAADEYFRFIDEYAPEYE
ncbi:MAG: hypothetical protein SPG80_01630 [Candidatus Ventricola sp.]|nr:hypothetical protein [Candidatus Ventricola sp.]